MGLATRIIGIDGLGGAGKSTLAGRLSTLLGGVPVVHTDDFASWDNPVDWWPDLVALVLEPLTRGETATFVPSSWGGPPKEHVTIEPGGVVMVEGVTAIRAAFRQYLALSIWVEAPRDVRLARGLERDGEEMRGQWEQWMAAEDDYVARERPHELADVSVAGY